MAQRKIKIGDIVTFTLVGREVAGTVIEDRGKLGRNGRHVYAIKVDYTWSDPMIYELEDDDFKVIENESQLQPA